jgi:hypothetical protein
MDVQADILTDRAAMLGNKLREISCRGNSERRNFTLMQAWGTADHRLKPTAYGVHSVAGTVTTYQVTYLKTVQTTCTYKDFKNSYNVTQLHPNTFRRRLHHHQGSPLPRSKLLPLYSLIVRSVRCTSYLHQHGSTSAAAEHSAHQNAGVGDIGVPACVRACARALVTHMLRSGVVGCPADRFAPTAYRPIPTASRLMPTVNRLIPTVRTPIPTAHRPLPKLVHDNEHRSGSAQSVLSCHVTFLLKW